ncbi:hypothetical protein ABAC460_07210 [Asticcacaulis sp. AC460]|nr:hypothetical protein ABAC460_07210 [Asticcacaulis sp. AC460]
MECGRVIVLIIVFLLGGLCLPAAAQDSRALVGVTAKDRSPSEATASLDFDRAAPEARIGGNDTNRITVTLMNTTRGQAVSFDPASSGLLRDVLFDQQSGYLQLTFVLAAKTHMEVTPDSQRRFAIRLTAMERVSTATGAQGAAAGARGATARALPPAAEPLPGEEAYALIPLKYADVSEVVGLLSEGVTVNSNDAFTPREPGFGSPGQNTSNTQSQDSAASPDDRPLGEGVDAGLAIDRRLNAVWVRGSPERVARVRAQIEMIDVPVPSVIFETEFVELTEAGARNVGIDFANTNGQIGVATIQSGQFIAPGFYPETYESDLNSMSLQAALYAQIAQGEGRIVSKPKIAAQSGATASIITGDALPILTAITLSGVNGVSQQVQYVNVGVTLQIAPRVSSDGFVSSHVFVVVSSVTGYSQGYPTISQRQAKTKATVRDGDAFVIGGLLQENELKTSSKIPLLGDIPLVGKAFRMDRSTRSRTELYILITPRIIWPRGMSEGAP